MQPENHHNLHPIRILSKALVLFLIFNLLFAGIHPTIGELSAFNSIYPGLERFPYGQMPDSGFHFTVTNLDTLFAAHVLSDGEKPADEYRVLVIGDSSVWGYLHPPDETLTGVLNAANLTTCSGKRVKFYNLGFPGISVVKDLFFLIYAQEYDPDLVIWVVSLLSFPEEQQAIPIVVNNTQRILARVAPNDLPDRLLNPNADPPSFWDKTIVGQRNDLMDITSLHLYGIFWMATGLDHVFPEAYAGPQVDLKASNGFYDWEPPTIDKDDLLFDAIEAGLQIAGNDPIILINEPIFVSSGENSQIRYNQYYPRWAYDEYRQIILEESRQAGWNYIDLWDLLPPDEFSNTEFHRTSAGEQEMARNILPLILSQICP